jgi:tellurite resistance protein
VRTTTTGAFSAPGLPPGDYLVAAVKEDAITEWQDPKFLEKVIAVATHITLGDGEKKSQELSTKTIR